MTANIDDRNDYERRILPATLRALALDAKDALTLNTLTHAAEALERLHAEPVNRSVRPLVEKLRDAAAQAGHYGAWGGGVLLEQAADEIERLHGELQEAVTAVRNERERCALIARNSCLVPPDGGSPTADERLICEEIERRIREQG